MPMPTVPGVTIVETEPAAPIRGVSTSIAAFVGLCADGPTGEPVFVGSLDAFTETFGGPVDGGDTPFYLPLAVEGFFRNGGSQCFVLRAGKATPAFAELSDRASGDGKAGRVVARRSGAPGQGGTVGIKDASRLLAALPDGSQGVTVLHDSAAVTGVDGTRRVLTVDSVGSFAAGDNVLVKKDPDFEFSAVVDRVGEGDDKTVVLSAPVPNGTDPVGGTVETAPLRTGDTLVRLAVPDGVSLRALVPKGSVVRIGDGSATRWSVVAATTADSVRLAKPLSAGLAHPASLATAEFDLTVVAPGRPDPVTYRHLSTSPGHPRWWGGPVVDDDYLRIVPSDALSSVADPRPLAGTVTLDQIVLDDPAETWRELDTQAGMKKLLALLAPVREISLVAAPGCSLDAQKVLVEHCESLYDRFAVLDGPRGADPQTVLDHRSELSGSGKGFAALYHPWIRIEDPARQRVAVQPPSGHIAGIIAATDTTRGVHKAPANAVIAGALGLERRLLDSEQGLLNPKGVNALRILPGRGVPVVWGARTTADSVTWQYINVRRLFLFLEESIQESLRAAVFEPNDLALWQRLKRTVTEFLTRVWRDGALFGATPEQAFFVRIDEALNPPATRKLGVLNVEIGVQPVYPAEFIVVRIGVWDGGTRIGE
ncbi:phage tail sheath subtilisin-like domain-containing protein [Streptomyces zaomyceticus]|uniref:phage tail sheath subtilisin-like domain-containing protein n=1 Tax=Streptomyces zaomyceticus TaxID=68286 RepID=UPI00343DD873